MDAQTPILTDERAARLLGTTARRVRAWVRRGELPGRTLPDGNIIIVLADLVHWIKAADSREAAHA